jgi:hypothetical protein
VEERESLKLEREKFGLEVESKLDLSCTYITLHIVYGTLTIFWWLGGGGGKGVNAVSKFH